MSAVFLRHKKLFLFLTSVFIVFLIGIGFFLFGQFAFTTKGKLVKYTLSFSDLNTKTIAPNDVMGEGQKDKILTYLNAAQTDLDKGNKVAAREKLILAEKLLTTWAPEGVKVRLPQNDQEKSELFYSNWAKTFGVIEPWWKTYQSVVRLINELND